MKKGHCGEKCRGVSFFLLCCIFRRFPAEICAEKTEKNQENQHVFKIKIIGWV